jgi:hypothetical protein
LAERGLTSALTPPKSIEAVPGQISPIMSLVGHVGTFTRTPAQLP